MSSKAVNKSFKDRGTITKIYLKNFTSYNEVVFTPGRNLNLVTGPNGTGKSTLVAAIALGLGGNVKTMGKSGYIKQYIKRGEDTAVIEIELRDTPTKVIKINRTFTENKSVWKLNNESVSEARIAEVTDDLNIQIGNLCQFLPQDRVKAFSEMDPKQLLLNTEQSVGDPKLYEYHQNLIQYRREQKQLEEDIAQRNSMLDLHTQKYQALEETVSGIKERKVIKKRIMALGQKRAWIVYDQSRKSLTQAKDKSDTVARKIKQLKQTLKPTVELKAEKEIQIRKLKLSIDNYATKINKYRSDYKKIIEQLENQHAKISEIRHEVKHDIEVENRRESTITAAETQKNKLCNDLRIITEELGTVESINEKSNDLSRSLQKQRNIVGALAEEMTVLRQEIDKNNRSVASLQHEHRQLSDVASKRLNLLKSRNQDAWKGVIWLRENIHKFSSPVHEPMMLNIQVKNEEYAKYFEGMIATRDLYAFVCEDKNDMNLLLTHLREEQNLVVNVVHSDPHEQYSSRPEIPIESIRRYGFQEYLSSLIEAPPTIMKYLITMYSIHNIPIGTEVVEDNIENIPAKLQCYLSPNNIYSVKVSRYTGDKSIRTVRLPKPYLLSMVVDAGKIRQIESTIKDYERRQNDLLTQLRPIEQKHRDAEEENTKLRNAKNQCQLDLQQVQGLNSRINLAIQKLQQLETERKNIEDIKAAGKERIMNVIKKQMLMYTKCNSLADEALKVNIESETVSMQLTVLQKELANELEETKIIRENLRVAEIEHHDLEKQLQPLKRETERLYDDAMRLTDGANPQDTARFKPFKTAFGKLPGTIEEIDEALQTAQARVYCLDDHHGGEDILRDYERTKEYVEKLKQEIETLSIKLEVNEQKIEEIRDIWLPLLQELVETINGNFSKYFTSLGCVGEISLGHGENPMDFEEYEIKIRVKFRDDDDLKDFTKERQSGGERSVTTAIYMISLQELSRVPFRCVDEINQAMDAVNERRVFDLIVKMTSKADSAQYFLLTPKLLPNLKYTEQVRVHIVFNGPYVVPWNRFNTIDYCDGITADRNRK
ncbi:hypothetical protein PV325_010331 [Microctonus aethiopoides]|uniref:Structural maintenance of chromosomes protein 5 n=1 Tax=Microctonus aethiopoides TaxID=144406 RepID=A0AA39C5G7_9HYME|nr:hypothetical protein PV326_006951 [Microctonus aethiopoides]KAK0088880.1 hypothetical protein PV325_010331 [Microctonus aethiopoides]KAK0158276.1 hypothetical protein PV328_009300 [Microctonus aethiopoides]